MAQIETRETRPKTNGVRWIRKKRIEVYNMAEKDKFLERTYRTREQIFKLNPELKVIWSAGQMEL